MSNENNNLTIIGTAIRHFQMTIQTTDEVLTTLPFFSFKPWLGKFYPWIEYKRSKPWAKAQLSKLWWMPNLGSIFLVSQSVSQSFWHCQNLLIVTVSKSLWHTLWHKKYGPLLHFFQKWPTYPPFQFRYLNLSNNRLNDLPSELSSMVNLREIAISFNRFKALPKCLNSCTKMETLVSSMRYISLKTWNKENFPQYILLSVRFERTTEIMSNRTILETGQKDERKKGFL